MYIFDKISILLSVSHKRRSSKFSFQNLFSRVLLTFSKSRYNYFVARNLISRAGKVSLYRPNNPKIMIEEKRNSRDSLDVQPLRSFVCFAFPLPEEGDSSRDRWPKSVNRLSTIVYEFSASERDNRVTFTHARKFTFAPSARNYVLRLFIQRATFHASAWNISRNRESAWPDTSLKLRIDVS